MSSVINGTLKDTTQFQTLANKAIIAGGGKSATDLTAFATDYIKVFSTGYNYAFGIAAGAMILSLVIYLVFNKLIPTKQKEVVIESKTEVKPAVSLGSNLKAVIISLV